MKFSSETRHDVVSLMKLSVVLSNVRVFTNQKKKSTRSCPGAEIQEPKVSTSYNVLQALSVIIKVTFEEL